MLLVLLALLAGCASPAEARDPAASANAGAPVPDALASSASTFGLKMLASYTWTAIDPKTTRFEWSGRPASGDREVLYSFWMPKLDASEKQLLPRLVSTAAANLATGEPCPPSEQGSDFVKLLGVERVVTVCFEPSPFYAKEFHHGIMHGVVSGGALTLVVVLSNDQAAAVVPLPKSIGARGR